ncbi:MAG: hypothetical protein ACLFPL_03085 [Candidatus Nanoarchaeia archaeon]
MELYKNISQDITTHRKNIFPDEANSLFYVELSLIMQFLSSQNFKILFIGEKFSSEEYFLKQIRELTTLYKQETGKDAEYIFSSNFNTLSFEEMEKIVNANSNVLVGVKTISHFLDPYKDIVEQSQIPRNILYKFDKIYLLRDQPDLEKDFLVAKSKFNSINGNTKQIILNNELKQLFSNKQLNVTLNDEVFEKVSHHYVTTRNSAYDEDGVKASCHTISPQQVETTFKLCQSLAKFQGKEKAGIEEAEIALDMLYHFLDKIAVNTQTGERDISRISPYDSNRYYD